MIFSFCRLPKQGRFPRALGRRCDFEFDMRLKLPITLQIGFLVLGIAITGVASDPFISEIVAANDKTLKDNSGGASDWIELHNPGSEPATLLGWGLSDDLETPLKWTFPDVSIPPGEFLLVHASGNNIADPRQEGYRLQMANLGQFLAGNEHTMATFRDALRVQELVEKILAA